MGGLEDNTISHAAYNNLNDFCKKIGSDFEKVRDMYENIFFPNKSTGCSILDYIRLQGRDFDIYIHFCFYDLWRTGDVDEMEKLLNKISKRIMAIRGNKFGFMEKMEDKSRLIYGNI
jgi:hypothetical protein